MSAHALLIPELDEVIERGSPERRAKTLRRITTLFLDGASQFNDDHLGLFGFVFSRLIAGAEVVARAELAHRLAPLRTVPAEVVLGLAHDDDIAVAGPVRVLSAISRTGAWCVAVKYSVRRLTPWARIRPMTTAPKHRQPTLVIVTASSALPKAVVGFPT